MKTEKEQIRAMKEWQLSDYAWNKSQWKMIMKFIKKLKEEFCICFDPRIKCKNCIVIDRLLGDVKSK